MRTKLSQLLAVTVAVTGPRRCGVTVLKCSGLSPTLVAPPLLAALCLAFAASPLARAQDASSATLLERHSKTAEATPTPSAEKPSLEISAGTPDHQKPAPAPEQRPSARELATPAAKVEKKTGVKTQATPAATPKAAEPPVADVMSLSSAKAVAVSAPLPEYPFQARHAHITRSGVCVMTVDTASGNVTDATMEQTTGNPLLDKSATTAFRKWRFKPGTVSKVRVPITYEPAPAPEETPAREHATPAATPKAAERLAADVMSLSSAKAVAVSAPLPGYPYEARSRHLMGSGVCVMTVDTASGNVTDATMEQSTGSPILDNSAVSTFRRWRFKPGTAPKLKISVTFSP